MGSSLFGEILSGLLPGIGQLSDTGAALIGFFTTITDGRMWRSLGWIILGVLLMILGGALMLRTVAQGEIARTVRSAV